MKQSILYKIFYSIVLMLGAILVSYIVDKYLATTNDIVNDCIRDVEILALAGYTIGFICYKMKEYVTTEYLFYKSIGTKSSVMLIQLIMANFKTIIILVGLFLIVMNPDSIFIHILLGYQLIILLFMIMGMYFWILHFPLFLKIGKILATAFTFLVFINIFLSFYMVLKQQLTMQNIVLEIIQNIVVINIIVNLISKLHLVNIGLWLVIGILGYVNIYRLDGLIIEESCSKKKNKSNIRMCEKSFVWKNRIISHTVREVCMSCRNKKNIINILTIYIFNSLILFFVESSLIILVVGCMFTVFLCIESHEYLFIEDISSIGIYKLCGESYSRFIFNKMITVLAIALGISSVTLIKLLLVNATFHMICIYASVMVYSIFYWCCFFTFSFTRMKRFCGILDNLKKFLVLVGMVIPFGNLYLIYIFISKGKKRWEQYVGVE